VNEFQSKLTAVQLRITQHREQLQEMQVEDSTLGDQINGLTIRLGQLKRDEENYKGKIQERQTWAVQLAQTHAIPGYGAPLKPEKADDFLQDLRQTLAKVEEEFASARRQHKRTKENLQERDRTAQREYDAVTHRVGGHDQELEAMMEEISQLAKESAKTNASAEQLEAKHKQMTKAEGELKAHTGAYDLKKMKDELEQWDSALTRVEGEVTKLEKTKSQLDKMQEVRVRLQVKQQEFDSLEEQADVIMAQHAGQLKRHLSLDSIPPQEELAEAFVRLEGRSRASVEKADKLLSDAKDALASAKADFSTAKTELKECLTQKNECDAKLAEFGGLLEYKEQVTQAEQDHRSKESWTELQSAIRDLYVKYKNTAKSKQHCPVCERRFNSEFSLESFDAVVGKTLAKVPSTSTINIVRSR